MSLRSDIFRNYGVLYKDDSLLCVHRGNPTERTLYKHLYFYFKGKTTEKVSLLYTGCICRTGCWCECLSVCPCFCVCVCVHTCTYIHGCMWKAGDASGHNIADGPGRAWFSVHVTMSVARHLVDALGIQAWGPDVSVRPCHLLLGPTTRHPELQWC